jgi:hypothetical protein
MKQLTIILLTLLISNFTRAQFPTDLQIDRETTREAEKLLKAYNNQLSLTPKQYLLAKKSIEESLAKRKMVLSDYKGKQQLDMLYTVIRQQDREMGNILTQYQYRGYETLRPELQPLKEIEVQQTDKI